MLRVSDSDVHGAARPGVAQIMKHPMHAFVAIGTVPAKGASATRIIPTPFDDFWLGKILDTLNALCTIRKVLSGLGHRRHLQETLPEDFDCASRTHEDFPGI